MENFTLGVGIGAVFAFILAMVDKHYMLKNMTSKKVQHEKILGKWHVIREINKRGE